MTTGTPKALEGVDPGLLETVVRDDGKNQVMYNGYPLYYFSDDKTAGDVNGQNSEDRWYLVTPEGYRLSDEVEGEPTE
jgi:predicted lipoprotein with Yx(FWY)xxD motif